MSSSLSNVGSLSANGRQRAGGGDELAGRRNLDVDAVVADPRLQLVRACRAATVWPWSSTTMSSAMRSASSRYCVVRMMVVPSRTSSREHLPQVAAAARVEAGGRLVEEQHLGAAHQAGRDIEAAAHATRVGLDERGREVGEVELLEQLVATLAGCGLRHATEPADGLQVEPGAHQAVDGGLLRGDADAATHGGRLVHDVEPGDGGAALGRLAERREDADRRGLAGSVVAEQPEHGARSDVQVEVAQRPQLAEPLAEPGGGDSAVSLRLGRPALEYSYGVLKFRT